MSEDFFAAVDEGIGKVLIVEPSRDSIYKWIMPQMVAGSKTSKAVGMTRVTISAVWYRL